MVKAWRILLQVCIGVLVSASLSNADVMRHDSGTVKIEPIVDDLYAPWAVGILPDGGLLITERDGVLIHFKNDQRQDVAGIPKVWVNGQGGLLDVAIARDFAQSRKIYLTYAEPRKGGAGTALGTARLSANGSQITDFKVLYRQIHASKLGRHFGSRVVEGKDGFLYVTVGDRGDRPKAQSLKHHNGKVIRVNPKGGSEIYFPIIG